MNGTYLNEDVIIWKQFYRIYMFTTYCIAEVWSEKHGSICGIIQYKNVRCKVANQILEEVVINA